MYRDSLVRTTLQRLIRRSLLAEPTHSTQLGIVVKSCMNGAKYVDSLAVVL